MGMIVARLVKPIHVNKRLFDRPSRAKPSRGIEGSYIAKSHMYLLAFALESLLKFDIISGGYNNIIYQSLNIIYHYHPSVLSNPSPNSQSKKDESSTPPKPSRDLPPRIKTIHPVCSNTSILIITNFPSLEIQNYRHPLSHFHSSLSTPHTPSIPIPTPILPSITLEL